MPIRLIRTLRLVVSLICLACGTAAAADINDPTRGDLVLFPGPLQDLVPAGAPATAVQGLGLNLPGRNFRAGAGWWSLVCDRGCRLNPVQLSVHPATHPVYDSEPEPSQHLRWAPLPEGLVSRTDPAPANVHLLALFKPVRSLSGLKLSAGPVTTWLHQGMASYPPGGRLGTMEVAIPVAGQAPALLVPRLLAAGHGAGESQAETLVLELRIGAQRQRLGTFDTGGIEGLQPVQPTSYLMWAGDLDGDGKLDLLIDLSGGVTRKVELFLSSLASGQDWVGSAGRFEFVDPSQAGC